MCVVRSGVRALRDTIENFFVPKMRPNEDFGRRNKRWNADVRCTFQWLVAHIIEHSRPWKAHRTSAFHLLGFWNFSYHLSLPNEDFGMRNKRGNPDFEGSPFQGREYSIWLQTIEKYIENLDFIFCQSFQNLRLRSIKLMPISNTKRAKSRNSCSPHGSRWYFTDTSSCYHLVS